MDNELYEKLCNLKSRLQNVGEGERKPIVCTDESLRLMAKYKPTTLSDIDNISGIGDTFIENYGAVFLSVIKKHIDADGVGITNSEREILSKLENRLVNINRRNRLLYSGKVNKDYGIDLVRFIDNYKELERFIIGRESGIFNLFNITEFEDDKLKSILKLIRQVNKIETETGNNELYIAYPFVQGKMEGDDFNVKAPLLLFPIKIDRKVDSISIKNDNSRDILYNTNLILANNKFNGKNEVLPDNIIDEFNSENYIDDMINFYSENNFFIQNKECEIERFLENRLSEFPNYKRGELEIKKYMVLGIYSMYVTSMYEDFHTMIKNENVTKLIKDLLSGMEGDTKSNDNVEVPDKIENEISYINELDYSQEKVLQEINHTDAIVVQGPPGTGKSQTITSIIAQAILQDKKVLMVSEKKTALDVIYSRLGELSKYAVIIDDVKNKNLFYEELNNILEAKKSSKKSITGDVNEKINNVNNNLDNLEKIYNKVYKVNDFGTNMYTVYHNCKRIDVSDLNEVDIYNKINNSIANNVRLIKYPILTKIYNHFKESEVVDYTNKYLSIVRNYPFIDFIKINLMDMDIVNFINKIDELNNFIIYYNNLPFYKKWFNKSKLNNLKDYITNTYFVTNDKNILEGFYNNLEFTKNFLSGYANFVSNKTKFNSLEANERDYASLVIYVKNIINKQFDECNDRVYNSLLYSVIYEFEKANPDVMGYIDNFDGIRNDIRKNIVEKKELTKALSFNKLLSDINEIDDNGRESKIEEMINRKRKMAINKFMSKFKLEMLDSIHIWLMTPEVVSDIMPFDKNLIDLVIFDEASQLYVEKSIPAIYRAKKVIVAGDQKQLKPSSLGTGRVLDEIDEEETTDGFLEYESLLDASRYKYKHTMLNYHYRSKYEELIAFSNYAFYNGKLMITSLSEIKEEKPIERIKVENGSWIDKKNKEEASEVIKLVKHILNTRENNETIGVITFNISQMNLIEDMIEKEKMTDQVFYNQMLEEENRYDNGENISFFVKNIESVQGDERDIIIFCVGYAKNEEGKVAIQFGWLNQDGGENRLNVAISRAKQKIYVITSIEPDELNVEGTKNDGPKLFKKYLEYAKALSDNNKELAQNILLSLLNKSEEDVEEDKYKDKFIDDVCTKLEGLGYNVEKQYGVGGYKIDIVVRSSDGKKNLLGIECDGRLYEFIKDTRERDYHRQKYLEARGWNMYRLWSSNWWKDQDKELNKIVSSINKEV